MHRSATQLEYKYVVLNSNGTVSHWKPGQNYKLDVLAARGTRVLVTETWDDGPRHVEVDMENADPPAAASTSSARTAAAPAQAPAQQQQQHSSNGNASSNGKKKTSAAANGAAEPSSQQRRAEPPRAQEEGPSSVPTAQEARPSPLTATSALPLSGTAIIQQEVRARVGVRAGPALVLRRERTVSCTAGHSTAGAGAVGMAVAAIPAATAALLSGEQLQRARAGQPRLVASAAVWVRRPRRR